MRERDKHFVGDVPQKAIIEDGGKILLIKNKLGFWELPGGRLNFHELPLDGLKREIREELQLKIEPISIFDVFTFKSISGMWHFAVTYVCKLAGDAKNMKPEPKIKDVHWIGKDDIKSHRMRKEHYLVITKYFDSKGA